MTAISAAANNAVRDFVTAGVPASGDHEPVKSDVRAVFATVDAALSSLTLAGVVTVAKATKALLDADLAHLADVLAVVYNDATAANNGIYVKSGGSGAGAWTITALALPATFADDLALALAGLEDIDAAAVQTAADRVQTGLDRAAASASATLADADAVSAEADRVAIMAALGVTGISAFYNTKALANAALAGLAANSVVMVFIDESLSNARTIYRKESGSYVLKANLSDDPVFTGDVTTTGGDFITNGAVRILQTYSIDHGSFSFETAGATFDGIKDPQLSYGYNRNLIFPAEPSLTVNMEVDYLSGGVDGTRTMEHYLQYTSADGLTQVRPFMFNIDRDADQVNFGFINVGATGFTFQSLDLLTNIGFLDSDAARFHKVGIGGNSEYHPTVSLDVQGSIRTVGFDFYTTGAGVEIRYQPATPLGRISCYDYTAGVNRNLQIEGAVVTLFTSTGIAEIYGNTLRFTEQRTPASAVATGTKGDFCHDTTHAYFCVATDTWKRVALSTW